jgi:hypothetical protein
VSHGNVGKKQDPNDLFEDANYQTKRNKEEEDRSPTSVDYLGTQKKPDDPKQSAPEKVLRSPGEEQEVEMDVVVPETRVDPLLNGKEEPQYRHSSDEEERVHEQGLIEIALPVGKGQSCVPRLSSQC